MMPSGNLLACPRACAQVWTGLETYMLGDTCPRPSCLSLHSAVASAYTHGPSLSATVSSGRLAVGPNSSLFLACHL